MLIDRYPVTYLGRASLAETLLRRRQDEARPTGRIVMGPAGSDLRHANLQTRELADEWKLGSEQPYARERMVIEELRMRKQQMQIAHLSTHSFFDFDDFLRSAIEFSGERLTVMELISDERLDFRGMQLLYLDSCESGISGPQSGGELQGLAWAATYAGASAVMASLWPVNDRAARLMAHSLYRHWTGDVTLMQAYRLAMLELREESWAANPFFWAPFVLIGDGFQRIRE